MIDEKQVQKMIDDAISKNAVRDQFELVPVPAHVHSGVDSSQVSGSDLAGPVLARVNSYTATATPAPPGNGIDMFEVTAATGALAFQPPYGAAFNGSLLRLRVTSSNAATARAVTFSTATGGYIAGTPALPASTTTGQTLTLGFEYDTGNAVNKWRLIFTASS